MTSADQVKKAATPPTLWKKIVSLDLFLDFHAPLLLILLVVFILRLPNYFEPYWYGDEGIYLTIGTALRYGRELYAEIVDHKTPIIYFLAMVSDQLPFRLLLTAWMLISTACFYVLSYSFFGKRLSSTVATSIFALLTTLPWFEGNIPNGELFVMGFVLVGAVVLLPTSLVQRFLSSDHKLKGALENPKRLFVAGCLFGLAILTKVPGLFDLVAFLTIGLLILTNELSFAPRQSARWWKLCKQVLLQCSVIVGGATFTVIVSLLFFLARGSFAEYLEFGLLYNFHYAGNWGLPFDHPLLLAAFSLPGKFILATSIVFTAILLRRLLRPTQQFALAWFALALFASLLSNRPYPHYFLQVVPPLALLLGTVVQQFESMHTRYFSNKRVAMTAVITGGVVALVVTVVSLLQVGFYPTASYYQNWLQLIQGQQSAEEYRNSFNYLLADNYSAAPILATAENNTIFIWGTNPVLYALSDTIPAGRFTVSFHIQDLDAYEETLADISETQPQYIVVMRSEENSFPELQRYLRLHYMQNSSYDHFTIWRRRSLQTLLY